MNLKILFHIQEVLKDPYCLYEEEYEEVLKRISKEQEMER